VKLGTSPYYQQHIKSLACEALAALRDKEDLDPSGMAIACGLFNHKYGWHSDNTKFFGVWQDFKYGLSLNKPKSLPAEFVLFCRPSISHSLWVAVYGTKDASTAQMFIGAGGPVTRRIVVNRVLPEIQVKLQALGWCRANVRVIRVGGRPLQQERHILGRCGTDLGRVEDEQLTHLPRHPQLCRFSILDPSRWRRSHRPNQPKRKDDRLEHSQVSAHDQINKEARPIVRLPP
jgi:hypothetical protein